jgi:tRNA U34 5-methylaminomethyl-2-thiouridine-forming methyltransferase MnmC
MKFEIQWTADSSPTLELENSSGLRERMHHSQGARSETIYIYGEALNRSQQFPSPHHVLSVGLGLGYNEVLTACHALKHSWSPRYLISYEQEAFLVDAFVKALQGEESPLLQAHQAMIAQMAQHYGLDVGAICAVLLKWRKLEIWRTEGRWHAELTPVQPFEVILYDPFSAKMNPDFWTEQSLMTFFDRWCAKSCVFSTYAARGVLTRSLRASGFSVDKRPGFAGKKDCTIAQRPG